MPSTAATPAREKEPDLSSWPTQTEAAAQLATNERTIRRWIESGRLRGAFRPATGRKPIAIVDPAGVEQLRRERQQVVMVETISPEPSDSAAGRPTRPNLPEQATALERLHSGTDPFFMLAAQLVRLAAERKPWLTLDEAAEYSGLPRAWLLAQARSGAQPETAGIVYAVNVGQGTRERWRFNREALKR